MPNPPIEKLLTIEEVAEIARVHVNTLRLHVRTGRFPQPGRSGRRMVWLESTIREWQSGLASNSEIRA